jgi:hypothetical protein
MFPAGGSAKQSASPAKPFSGGDGERLKRSEPYLVSTNFGEHVMTSKTGIIKYLAIRTAAFVGLTAVSTAVMALPYLA